MGNASQENPQNSGRGGNMSGKSLGGRPRSNLSKHYDN